MREHVERNDESRNGEQPRRRRQPPRLQRLGAVRLRLQRDEDDDEPVDAKGREHDAREHLPREGVDGAKRGAHHGALAALRAALAALVEGVCEDVRDCAHIRQVDNLHGDERAEGLAHLVEIAAVPQRRVAVDVNRAVLRTHLLWLWDVAKLFEPVAADEHAAAHAGLPKQQGGEVLAAAPFASNALPSCAASASIVGQARMAAAPGDESAREARGIRAEVAMDTSSIE
eukprot:CAMPEP_0196674190 /NCGR_PEP_ID=MMETSP1090-20130531/3376_1 /TAXON_ID=37098 /ORGANISM="Isochrysis sp, Strain CCMP1244" /LENGTH=228 /DNA_ID=CAMNT_0042011985 /DNA_START=930 /DNA_END=1617 /DNA_ORIENTATION=-